jgi:hypothetical protein
MAKLKPKRLKAKNQPNPLPVGDNQQAFFTKRT